MHVELVFFVDSPVESAVFSLEVPKTVKERVFFRADPVELVVDRTKSSLKALVVNAH